MLEQYGDEILQCETIDTGYQIIKICTHHCFTRKIVATCEGQTTINTPITITLQYMDWQNNHLSDENRPVKVCVTGPGKTQELVLTPTNGQAEFDFVSEVPGTFTIKAEAEFPCDIAEIEVVVS